MKRLTFTDEFGLGYNNNKKLHNSNNNYLNYYRAKNNKLVVQVIENLTLQLICH